MNQLRQLQEAFFEGMLKGNLSNPALLISDAALDGNARMNIYADGYTGRLTDALLEDFPLTAQLLGDDFYALAQGYVQQLVSQHYSLQGLGDAFVGYIAARTVRRDAADLARLECLKVHVYVAPDRAAVGIDSLIAHGDDMATKRLEFLPSVAHQTLEHDVVGLTKALTAHERVLPPALLHNELVVWRRDFDVWHTALQGPAADALRLAFDGANVAALCECFAQCNEPVNEAFAALGAWFTDGWIGRVA